MKQIYFWYPCRPIITHLGGKKVTVDWIGYPGESKLERSLRAVVVMKIKVVVKKKVVVNLNCSENQSGIEIKLVLKLKVVVYLI